MNTRSPTTLALGLCATLSSCHFADTHIDERSEQAATHAASSPYDKPGFHTQVIAGKLWVLKRGQKRAEKHITMIHKGPAGMTIRALDRQTALEYLAAKPGFRTLVDAANNRVWVLRGDQQPSEKHISLIRKGPGHLTVAALDRDTALHYLASRPGFEVEVEGSRLWVLRPGQHRAEKHITRIGAGPLNSSIKALDKDTLLEYLGTVPGFRTKCSDGRLWIFPVGAAAKMPEKHVTKIGKGPQGVSLKAENRAVLDAYLTAYRQH